MTVTSKVRLYDLAKELKLDTKRLIEEVRREGVDVSVPSNSISKELAEKIRTKYFPKKETAAKRIIKVVKRASLPTAAEEAAPEVEEIAAPAEPEAVEPEIPEAAPAPATTRPAPARVIKRLTPAIRAEQPSVDSQIAESTASAVLETEVSSHAEPAGAAGLARSPEPGLAPAPSRQIRVLRPTAAA